MSDSIYRNMINVYYELDDQWRFTTVNDRAVEMFQAKREELLGKPLFDVLLRTNDSVIVEKFKTAVDEKRPVHFELESKRYPGTWVEVHAYPLDRGLSVFSQDITERKKTEQMLREALTVEKGVERNIEREKDRLTAVLNSIQDDILFVDIEGTIILANPSALKNLGFKSSDNLKIFDLMNRFEIRKANGDTIKAEDTPSRRAMRNQVVSNEEQILRFTTTNKEKYINVSSSPVKDSSNNIIGAVIIARDITSHKQAEDAIKESEERFKALSETSPIGVGVSSAENLLIYTNPAYERILGYDHDELIGMKSGDVYWDPAERKSWLDILNENGTVRDFEVRLKRKDGTPLWASVNASPVRFWGKPAVMGTIQNITERKRSEEELCRSRDDLERRVDERTQELRYAYDELQSEMKKREKTEDELRQSHKMEAIGTLAGGIAHDFNNILGGIIGFTEMALEDSADRPKVQQSLTRVLQSSTRAKDLIRQILAFSRKTNHQRNPFSITPILKETIKLLRASIPATVEIKFSTTAQSDTVVASPTEIQQIIMNLATNAFMAMEEKGGTVDISLTDTFYPYLIDGRERSAEYLQITVKDTGTGMTPEVMRKVFDPFFTTRETGKGTGMGLAVVYGIVKGLCGEIALSSEPGEGSTFRIFLPKTKAEEQPKHDGPSEVPRGKETILFVEDEEILTDWGKTVLENLGYTVSSFRDPQEALLAFARSTSGFDLVITDHAMPKMLGSELARGILTLRKDIPVVLYTGYQEPISPEKAAEIGITEVLLKPLTKAQLARAVRRVLDTKNKDE